MKFRILLRRWHGIVNLTHKNNINKLREDESHLLSRNCMTIAVLRCCWNADHLFPNGESCAHHFPITIGSVQMSADSEV